ncbi:MAG: hypothetical protein AABW82_05155 [Nanoarchaeota archaeon]
MTDIFDTTILCKNCHLKMKPGVVSREGFELRAVKCDKCKDTIIHPGDLNGMQNFQHLRGKNFHVKLRMVGNSHAISIPKEIVDFMNERHKNMRKQMDDMVRLCFEDFDTLKVSFHDEDAGDETWK